MQDTTSGATALETFERAPPSAFSFADQSQMSQLPYPPGRNEGDERKRREADLADDEEMARQLTAQLRLTSPAEHSDAAGFADAFREDEQRLPRVGDGRSGPSGLGDGGFPVSGEQSSRLDSADDGHYGVEYHAMDSDSEDAFYAEPPRAAGNAQMICNVIIGLFKASVLRSRTSNPSELNAGLV
mmetsp:Transcript_106960/g.190172  ORF Transcript_106960/g.190172 Transcript_106960/m.190172 type:complete len:185 (-) Transcript_106960:294-848(-)